MLTADAERLRALLPWEALIEALREMFASGCESPVRHHHTVPVPGEADATLLLMPAWRGGDYLGVKMVNVFPGNAERGRPAISAAYLLSSAANGELLALLDGAEITARRTAAASALAADFLARRDARSLLVVGTGRMAPSLAAAHASIRPLSRIRIWGRQPDKAAAMARALRQEGLPAEPAGELQREVGDADIVSCATLSTQPVVHGEWLQPGTHLDLVGGFRPDMREADDEAIRRSRVFVDTREGACSEAGDIVQPIAGGVLAKEDIVAELAELCRGDTQGRAKGEEITLFKSVGASLEDLAAAILAYEQLSKT
jgi:ornithine cyclodeaminase